MTHYSSLITKLMLYPDVIFHGGQVLTVDRAFSRAQAVAVQGERIVAVGDDATVLALAGPRTRQVPLRGRTLLPGLIDAHAHMDREGLRGLYPSLAGARSIADVQVIVRRAVERARPGEWVVFMPLGEPPYYLDPPAGLAEGRYPDRWDLDQAAPDNPVYIRAPWGFWSDRPPFVAIANSVALQRAGVDRDTPAPSSAVTIERDAAGEPTGRLLEHNLIPVLEQTLMQAVPRFTPELRLQALRESQRLYLAAGTTGIYEGHGVDPVVRQVYKRLWDEGGLRVRSYLAVSPLWTSPADAARDLLEWGSCAAGPGFGDDWLRVGGLGISPERSRDVAPLLRGALPYTGWAGFVEQYWPWADYREIAWLAARHDVRLNTIASAEVEPLLELWEEIDREIPLAGRRWVLVHGRVIPPALLPRIRRLGAVVTTIAATHVYRDGLAAVERGEDAEHLVPHRALEEAGVAWALATDNKPYPLLETLWVALARAEQREGRIIGPGQRLSRAQAMRAATAGGAYVCFDERRRGSLEVGKLADLIVLSGDPLTIDLDAFRDLRVDLTMVGGQIVHGED